MRYPSDSRPSTLGSERIGPWCNPYRTWVVLTLGVVLGSAAASGQKIYWTDDSRNSIQRANLDGSEVEVLVDLGYGRGWDIALDETGGKVYWNTSVPVAIYRANLDGSNVEFLVTPESGIMGALALNPSEGTMYWTTLGPNVIHRAALDGSNVTLVLATFGPAGIALDLGAGKVYWGTHPGPTLTTFWRANLDGSEQEPLIPATAFPQAPIDIAMDVGAGKMYFATGYAGLGAKGIWRANLDGSGVELVVADQIPTGGVALDLPAGKLYWTHLAAARIYRANLDGSSVEEVVPTPTFGPPRGLAILGTAACPTPGGGCPPALDSDGDGTCNHCDACPGEDDRPDFDGDGIPDCVELIPTLGSWGLVGLTLALMAAAKVKFSRKRG